MHARDRYTPWRGGDVTLSRRCNRKRLSDLRGESHIAKRTWPWAFGDDGGYRLSLIVNTDQTPTHRTDLDRPNSSGRSVPTIRRRFPTDDTDLDGQNPLGAAVREPSPDWLILAHPQQLPYRNGKKWNIVSASIK